MILNIGGVSGINQLLLQENLIGELIISSESKLSLAENSRFLILKSLQPESFSILKFGNLYLALSEISKVHTFEDSFRRKNFS